MTIATWSNKEEWDNHLAYPLTNITTSEHVGDIEWLGYCDNFDNSDLSTDRWLVVSNARSSYSESDNLYITSDGANSVFELMNNNQLPDTFKVTLRFQNRSSGSVLKLKLTDSAKTVYIRVNDSTVSVYDSSTYATLSASITNGYLNIERYASDTYAVIIYDGTNSHSLYIGALGLNDNPYIAFRVEMATSSDSIDITSFDVKGYPMPIGEVAYAFNAIGEIQAIDVDLDQGPDVVHYIQISPDGHLDINDAACRWYGTGGENTFYTGSTTITDIPISSSYKYYYRVFFIPAQFETSQAYLGLASYVQLRDSLFANLGNASYHEIQQMTTTLGFASYYKIHDDLLATLGYSSFSSTTIPIALSDTDKMISISDIRMSNEEITYKYIDTVSMDGLAIYSNHTGGALFAETDYGTYLVPANTLIIMEKGAGTYIKLITTDTITITNLGVFGIWL